MNITQNSNLHSFTGKRLRRARKLWCRLIRNAVLNQEQRTQPLWDAARRASQRKLWLMGERNIRWAIMRNLWRQTPGYEDLFGWHRWSREQFMTAHGDLRPENQQQKVA